MAMEDIAAMAEVVVAMKVVVATIITALEVMVVAVMVAMEEVVMAVDEIGGMEIGGPTTKGDVVLLMEIG